MQVNREKFLSLLDEYSKILVVMAENLENEQLQNIGMGLRGHSVLLMGKNTRMQRCMKMHSEKTGNTAVLRLLPFIVENVGLIFTRADFKEVIEEVAKHRVGTPARGLVIKYLYEDGLVFPPEALDGVDFDLSEELLGGLSSMSLTSPSLANLQTNLSAASLSEVVIGAYKNVLAFAHAINYPFPRSEKMKEYLKDPSNFSVASTSATPAASTTATPAASTTATPAAADAPAVAVDEKKKELAVETDDESDDDMGFGLFD